MEIIGEKVLYEERWTLLKEKAYRDRDGRLGSWTYVERQGRRRAVVIVALTADSDSLVLIEQFRVPLETTVVEFPAGLVDADEDLETAARRELMEETGFEGEILEISPPVSTSAGLTTETVHMVYMRVGEQPASEPGPEGSERITVRVAPPRDFGSLLEEYQRKDLVLDAKVYVYLKERSEALSQERNS